MSKIKGGAIKDINMPNECRLTTVVSGKNATKNICMTPEAAQEVIKVGLNKDSKLDEVSEEIFESEFIEAKKVIAEKTGCKEDCEADSTVLAAIADKLDPVVLEKAKENMAAHGASGEKTKKEWLSNEDIDESVLTDVIDAAGKLKNPIKVYHLPFHMAGFMLSKEEAESKGLTSRGTNFPTKLCKIASNFNVEVVKKGYDFFCCVLNTDTYAGQGVHWVALLVDIKNKSIEYFDSVGRPPFEDVLIWISKVQESMELDRKNWKIAAPFNGFAHQKENSDCGVFSFFFIIQRILHNVPYSDFLKFDKRVTDTHMREKIRSQFFSATKIE